jgi:hypothetical protein
MLAFLFVLFSTAAPIPQALVMTYDGPLGLAWGMSPAEATKRLEGLEWTQGNGTETDLHFTGQPFGGLATEHLEAAFTEDKLTRVGVVLEAGGTGGATRVYEYMLREMRKTYGDPYREGPPPPPLKEKGEARQSRLDKAIKEGAWKPAARWAFKNGAIILISVDWQDGRLVPMWIFGAPGEYESLKRQASRDF